MKRLVLFLLLINHFLVSSAQQGVAINSDGTLPNSSAMLDIKSTSRGILVPRMTSAQRAAIITPARGLMVYDNTTNSFWFYNGTSWQEMNPAAGSTTWTVNNTHQYNSNAGNVGIGISNPTQKLHVAGNILTTGRIDADGVVEANGLSSLGAFYVSGNSLFQGSVSGSTAQFSGIVTSNTGLNIRDDNGYVRFRSADNTLLGQMSLNGNDLLISTNGPNTEGRVIVYTGSSNRLVVLNNGMTGIGTSTPISRLHINSGTANSVLRLQSSNFPTLHFNRDESQVASIQASDTWLNILSSGGQVRLNNQLYVDDAVNRVGIGTSSPDQKLHVAGSVKISSGQVLNNDDKNMLPIAYGKFNSNGGKQNGTSNISCGIIAGGDFVEYRISISGGVDLSDAIVSVTPYNTNGNTVSVHTFSNVITIYFYNSILEQLIHSDFSIVIHN